MRFVLISIILHLGLLIPLSINQRVDIDIISSPPRELVVTPFRKIITPFRKQRGGTLPGGGNLSQERALAESEIANTNLLTKKELVFQTYLERIKEAVEPGWVESVRAYHNKSKIPRNISATVLWVILLPTGLVVDVIVVRSSGDNFLDNLAILSIKDKTFPNPPKNLLDRDGFGRLLWTYRVR